MSDQPPVPFGLGEPEEEQEDGPRTLGHRVRLAARRVLVTILGTGVLIAGIAMLALPGPGWVTIFGGLAILGTEYHWARRLLAWTRQKFQHAYRATKQRVTDRREARDVRRSTERTTGDPAEG